MIVVVDASAALAMLLPLQMTEAADRFLAETASHQFLTPFVFDWEVLNILGARRAGGRLSQASYFDAMSQLETLEIARGEPFDAQLVVDLALAERLSLFDAAYLDAALAEGDAIASRDADLLAAAARHGLVTFDLR